MISYPWDSVATSLAANGYLAYDRHFTAANWTSYIRRFFTTGVFVDEPNSLQVEAAEGLAVKVAPGYCNIFGTFGENEDYETLTFEPSEDLPRIDTIVARWDANIDGREIQLHIVKGVAQNSPVRPELTNQASIKEIGLADVLISPHVSIINQADITDTRLETERCGVVTPFAKVDTTDFFLQLRDATERNIDLLQRETGKAIELSNSALDGTLAGNLQNQIEAVATAADAKTRWDFGENDLNENGIMTPPLENAAHGNVFLNVTNGKLFQNDGVDWKLVYTMGTGSGGSSGGIGDVETLEEASWDNIINSSEDVINNPGNYTKFLGQIKQVFISGYNTVPFRLIGISHDMTPDGSKTSFTFMCSRILDRRRMNATNTNSGGFASSEMKLWLNGALLSAFPGSLQSAIKTVRKTSANSSGGYTDCKIWLLSERELFGTTTYANEGTQYQYWIENNNASARIMKDTNNTAQYWWLRSPDSSSSFGSVDTNGTLYNYSYYANNVSGVVPCFTI